jgi:hypothetical protein
MSVRTLGFGDDKEGTWKEMSSDRSNNEIVVRRRGDSVADMQGRGATWRMRDQVILLSMILPMCEKKEIVSTYQVWP